MVMVVEGGERVVGGEEDRGKLVVVREKRREFQKRFAR